MTEHEKDRAVCDAATAETPWEAHGGRVLVTGPGGYLIAETYRRDADAEFIARARTRWPAALDEIERLRTILSRVAASGLLCDPGCCGYDCACEKVHALLKETKLENKP